MSEKDWSVPLMCHDSSTDDDDHPEGKKEQRTEEKNNEDIYCKALAERIQAVTPPATVGFFADLGRNKRKLLDKIEDYILQGEQNKDAKEDDRCCYPLVYFFQYVIPFIWCVTFFIPGSIQERKGVRYIFINFNIWGYVGSDYPWAGLVTTLLDEIEGKNKLCFSVFRGFFREPASVRQKWVLKSWYMILFICNVCLLISIPLCLVFLHQFTIPRLFIGIGLPLAVIIIPLLSTVKNYYYTLKERLRSKMNKKNLKAQLGFMHSVKQEVETITKFLRFTEHFEEQEIRVILKITNLDHCAPDKVVAVLDAFNILLSDKEAPFISILAADPSILVESIQETSKAHSNGYVYLDQIVCLPFYLPRMNHKTKSQFLEDILTPCSHANSNTQSHKKKGMKYHKERRSSSEAERGASNKSGTSAERFIKTQDYKDVLECLKKRDLDEYIPGNFIQMQRVVNTVLTILTMVRMGFEPKAKLRIDGKDNREIIEEVIDWVILAARWPCRLSWILQCEEDEWQRSKYEGSQARHIEQSQPKSKRGYGSEEKAERGSKTLLASYLEHAEELREYMDEIKKLFELDQDYGLFINFLNVRKHFTVKEASYVYDMLINLDTSLKRRFELIRSLNTMIVKEKEEVATIL